MIPLIPSPWEGQGGFPLGRARVGFFFSPPVITMIPSFPPFGRVRVGFPLGGQGGLGPGLILYLNLTSSFMLSLYSLLLIRSSMFTCMR